MRHALRFAFVSVTLGLVLTGCSRPNAGQAPVALNPDPPVLSASPSLPPPREDVVSVAFRGINERGFPEVELTNLTGKDIETIRGGFQAKTADGVVVWSTGLTVAVPGQTFLAAGDTLVTVPFGLNRKAALMDTLKTDPASLSFTFQAHGVTFVES